MKIFDRLRRKPRAKDKGQSSDVFASLILAARQDAEFKRRVLLLLELPIAQREPLVRAAVAEMEALGESPGICAAFLALGTLEGAQVATGLLERT